MSIKQILLDTIGITHYKELYHNYKNKKIDIKDEIYFIFFDSDKNDSKEIDSIFSFIHPNVKINIGEKIEQIGPIKKGEKIFMKENLAQLGMSDFEYKLKNFVFIAEPQRNEYNVQFIDKNTLIALRDIKKEERRIEYYSPWTKKYRTAPNMIIHTVIQFGIGLILIILIIFTFIGISLFT